MALLSFFYKAQKVRLQHKFPPHQTKIQYNQRQVFHIHRSTSLERQNNDTIKVSHTCGKFFFKGLCRSVCRCRAVQIRRITVMIGLHVVVDACGRGCSIIKRKPILLSFLEHNSKGVLFVPMSKLNKERPVTECPNSCQKFLANKWFRQVIVCTTVQPINLIFNLGFCSQHQYR